MRPENQNYTANKMRYKEQDATFLDKHQLIIKEQPNCLNFQTGSLRTYVLSPCFRFLFRSIFPCRVFVIKSMNQGKLKILFCSERNNYKLIQFYRLNLEEKKIYYLCSTIYFSSQLISAAPSAPVICGLGGT